MDSQWVKCWVKINQRSKIWDIASYSCKRSTWAMNSYSHSQNCLTPTAQSSAVGWGEPRCNVITADCSEALSEFLRGGVLRNQSCVLLAWRDFDIFKYKQFRRNLIWQNSFNSLYICSWLIFNISRILIDLDNWICQRYNQFILV